MGGPPGGPPSYAAVSLIGGEGGASGLALGVGLGGVFLLRCLSFLAWLAGSGVRGPVPARVLSELSRPLDDEPATVGPFGFVSYRDPCAW